MDYYGIIEVKGYLVDVTNAIQHAMVHYPPFQEMVKKDGFYRWYTELVRYTERLIIEKSGIEELMIRAV